MKKYPSALGFVGVLARIVLHLAFFFAAFPSLFAQAQEDPSLLAIDALRNAFPSGMYVSRNPLEILNNAVTHASESSVRVTVSQSRPIFSSDEAYCEVRSDGSQLVKFTQHGNSFEIEVSDAADPTRHDCRITFDWQRLSVKSGVKSHSIGWPCQAKYGELGGGINWSERRSARNPQPLCPGVEE